jgi:hypothetical protein
MNLPSAQLLYLHRNIHYGWVFILFVFMACPCGSRFTLQVLTSLCFVPGFTLQSLTRLYFFKELFTKILLSHC